MVDSGWRKGEAIGWFAVVRVSVYIFFSALALSFLVLQGIWPLKNVCHCLHSSHFWSSVADVECWLLSKWVIEWCFLDHCNSMMCVYYQIYYNMSVTSSDTAVLSDPTVNIPSSGPVPSQPSGQCLPAYWHRLPDLCCYCYVILMFSV